MKKGKFPPDGRHGYPGNGGDSDWLGDYGSYLVGAWLQSQGNQNER
jgi:hypothetical protein